ncbi:MAG: TM0106 family RecB-like putative nuclease [Thermoleophilia bacterium]
MHLLGSHVLLSPSDLTAYLACEHLTGLSLQVARHEIVKPDVADDQLELLFRKGRDHEDAYLQSLIGQGLSWQRIDVLPDHDWDRAARETVEAMEAGVGFVYQGVLMSDGWRGQADFLMRVETPSDLGPWSYEALDTKLARHAKPAYILQLCFYSEQLQRIQGVEPAHIGVVLGNQMTEEYALRDFTAYYRRVCHRLQEFVADPPPTEALPCSHCSVCGFRTRCEEYWEAIDHLSGVAGISRRQIEKLEATGISTLADLGAATPAQRPPGIVDKTFEKLCEQAALQADARKNRKDDYRILPPVAASGFSLLPDASPGDLFFDFEGNPFWDADGSLEYLWGITDADDVFTALWAASREEEQAAFEQFIDLVRARLEEHPDMHVYHYSQYEITALRRIMGRYGTREAELDDLLRGGVFSDLFKVVTGGLRVSRPGYGLKEMEHFLSFERDAEIRDGGTSIVEFERWMIEHDKAILDGIAAYNTEDCISTRLLRDWLLERRTEALAKFGPFPLPEPVEPRPITPERAEEAARKEVLRAALLATDDGAHALAAHLLDYHRRERKPVYWALFDKADFTEEQLLEDSTAIAGLERAGKPRPEKRSVVYTFTYPAQEQKVSDKPYDHATLRSAGKLISHDRDARSLELKRGPSLEGTPLPQALLPGGPYQTRAQESALERIGRSLLAADGRYAAIGSVLRRDPFGRDVQTNDIDEMAELLLSLDGRHLVIQGPPGSGKTYTSGRLIARLIEAGKRVGVASTSHRAIHKLLAEVEEGALERGVAFHGRKKATSDNAESLYPGDGIRNVFSNADADGGDLLGGTAWLFSDAQHDGMLDYLFIDEAGQVSLADALAMGTCARNLVLIGDPQQLGQVLQGSHPVGSDASVLGHLLDGKATIAADRGIFLEKTYRLHPDVCGFISEEFYEGRLHPDPATSTRTTPLGTGLRWAAVEHEGNRQESVEEVEAVRAEIEALERAGVALEEIKVVAPYNAQVELLRSALPDAVEVGTVDKFQGQQARVVFYSMASSSGEDVPRGLDFLFSRNRFNVAISRAECLAYLVCSPRLLEVDCRTIEHMRLANALCRFVEISTPADGS